MSNKMRDFSPMLQSFYTDFRHEVLYLLNSIIPAAGMTETYLASEGVKVPDGYEEQAKQLAKDAQHFKELFEAISDSQVSADSRQFLTLVEEMFQGAYHMESQVSAMIQISAEHDDTLPHQFSELVSILRNRIASLLRCLDDARTFLRHLL